MTSVAPGDPYATVAELHAWLKVPDSKTDRDAEWARRLASSTKDINNWTHRNFWTDPDVTTRTYRPGRTGVDTDDFYDLSSVVITPYLGTTAGTPWDNAQLEFEPLNGVVNGTPGWPYHRICGGLGGHPLTMNMFYSATRIQLATKFGWADCPEPVNTACLVLAASDNKLTDAPFGVAGFGDYAIRIRSNPVAQEKLDPYVLNGTAANSLMVSTGRY